MLRVASDASTIEVRIKDLYPGEDGIIILDWESCLECDREVDAYIYVAGIRQGYCFTHYDPLKAKIRAE